MPLLLRDWQTFFYIVGSAAAALTGLQFVVIALGAQVRLTGDPEAVEAFGTPNIVHFCAVLTVSALIAVPGHTRATLGTSFVLLGVAGIVYGVRVGHRARRQTGYVPVFEDWLWHVALPITAYAAIFVTGLASFAHAAGALYFVAATTLLLLFVGIHNAWDSAVYMSTRQPDRDE